MLTPILRPILQPVMVPVDYEYGDGDVFNPLSLFAAGEQGFWYDPSDFSTLFQDAAGTPPVTAVGQPVGLVLDKSKGLVLGSELASNGHFTTNLTGWFVGANVTASATGGEAQVTFAGPLTLSQTKWFALAGTYIVGKMYEVVFDATYVSGAGDLQVGAGYIIGKTISIASNAGVKTTYTARVAGKNNSSAGQGIIAFGASAAATVWKLDNISVKELSGNHAYQTTALSRPTVQSGYNAFDKTDDHLLVAAGGGGTTGFLLACGVVVPAAGTARTIFSDRGTNAGYKLGIDATNKVVFSGGTGVGYTTLTSANALTAGQKYVVIAWHDGTNLNLSINGVPETPVACGTVTAGTSTLTIGKDNDSASGYWGDSIYTAVYQRNDSSSAAQRSGLYTHIVGKMGGL